MNQQRLNRVRDFMAQQGLQQIIVTSTASVYYLTGLWVEPHERMIALYLSMTECILFGNEIFGLPEVEGAKLCIHADGENPVEALAGQAAQQEIAVCVKSAGTVVRVGVKNQAHRMSFLFVRGNDPQQKGSFKNGVQPCCGKAFCRLLDRMAAAAERNKKYVKSTEGE